MNNKIIRSFIAAWESSDFVAEVMRKTGFSRNRTMAMVTQLRRKGFPLKKMRLRLNLTPDEVEDLKGYIEQCRQENAQKPQDSTQTGK